MEHIKQNSMCRVLCSSSSEIFLRHLVQIAMLVGLMAAFSHKYASLMKPLSQANAAPYSVPPCKCNTEYRVSSSR